MRHRHAPPRLWLMTDERAEDALWGALARLPRGSGIVFRHHATPARARRALFERVRRIARARGLLLVLAGSARLARAWGADGAHNPGTHPAGLFHTASAHDRRAFVTGLRARADVLFVSPVFATRSHPGARALGAVRFGLIVRGGRDRAVALGGMTRRRFGAVSRMAAGWAAIDAWSVARDQKPGVARDQKR